MSENSKINIYVNSKNRRTDETASNFNVIIPDGLLKVTSNEEFELNVISFNCYNTFYHCNNNSNKFQIIFRNNLGSLYATQDLLLTNGNPNVYAILSNGYIDIELECPSQTSTAIDFITSSPLNNFYINFVIVDEDLQLTNNTVLAPPINMNNYHVNLPIKMY